MEPVQNLIHKDHPCPCGSGRMYVPVVLTNSPSWFSSSVVRLAVTLSSLVMSSSTCLYWSSSQITLGWFCHVRFVLRIPFHFHNWYHDLAPDDSAEQVRGWYLSVPTTRTEISIMIPDRKTSSTGIVCLSRRRCPKIRHSNDAASVLRQMGGKCRVSCFLFCSWPLDPARF